MKNFVFTLFLLVVFTSRTTAFFCMLFSMVCDAPTIYYPIQPPRSLPTRPTTTRPTTTRPTTTRPTTTRPPPPRPQPTTSKPVEKEREFEEIFETAIRRCTESWDVTDLDDILNTMCKFKVPTSKNFPCWFYCFLDEFDIIQGRKINWKKAREYTKYKLLPFNYDSGVELLYNLCEKEVKYKSSYSVYCDLAVDYLRCQIRYWDRAGLPKNLKRWSTIL